jgi:hypothetical protein
MERELMAGDSKNTAQWQGADVYIGTDGLAGPTTLTGAWPAGFSAVGLLDGEEGITEGRDGDTSENYAWGGVLYRRTTSKHKRTFKFVMLEDNAITFGLVNPGSTRTTAAGVRTSVIKVPESLNFAVGFELRDGSRVKRRSIKSATVEDVAEIKESETDPTVYEVTIVVFPEADGTLYRTVETDPTAAPASA